MKYPYLLLDADNTLFDFDAGNRHAFHEVCARYDIPDTEESFQCYERCNNAMWAAFDRGECTKDFLVVERFRRFLKEMGLDRDAARCNELHLQVLGQNTLLLPQRRGGGAAVPAGGQRHCALYHRGLYFGGSRGQQAQRRILRLRFLPH